jgi:hypothetical protein
MADARRIRDTVIADCLAEGEQLAGAVASCARAGERRLAWVSDAMLLGNGHVALDDLIEPRLAQRLVRLHERPADTGSELVPARSPGWRGRRVGHGAGRWSSATGAEAAACVGVEAAQPRRRPGAAGLAEPPPCSWPR